MQAVAGDADDVLVQHRKDFTAIGEERARPARQVEMITDLIAQTQERSAPVQRAYREAAATDSTVAASFIAAHERRHQTFAAAISMIDPQALRLAPAVCADTLWAIGSPEVFHLLRNLRGWTPEQYREWLGKTAVHQLLNA